MGILIVKGHLTEILSCEHYSVEPAFLFLLSVSDLLDAFILNLIDCTLTFLCIFKPYVNADFVVKQLIFRFLGAHSYKLLSYPRHAIFRLFVGQRCKEGKILVREARIDPWTIPFKTPRASIYAKRLHSRKRSWKGKFVLMTSTNLHALEIITLFLKL